MTRPTSLHLLTTSALAAAAALAPSMVRAQDPYAPSPPTFTLELEPGMSALVLDPATGVSVGCSGAVEGGSAATAECRPTWSGGAPAEVELEWGGEHADRHDRRQLTPEAGARYRPRWVENDELRIRGTVFLVLGQLGAGVLAVLGIPLLLDSGTGLAGLVVELLATALGVGSLIGGSYLAGLRSHAELDRADAVTAGAFLHVDEERALAGVRGAF
jgi:hypothetical protein